MVNQGGLEPENENVFGRIVEGMVVFDSNNEKVGAVEAVYMGTSHQEGKGSATAETPPDLGPSVMRNVANAFDPLDDVPDELRERLAYDGFVRVDSSRLLARDRYILPDQIETVSGDRVILNVPYRELIKD